MGLWGKIISAAGQVLDGPLGVLVGYQPARRSAPAPLDGTRKIGFTIGVIVLAAKMAKADGAVSRLEVEAFRSLFRIPEDDRRNVERLFDRAKQDAAGFEPYARQIARLLSYDPAVLRRLMDCLFEIAMADGVLDAGEDRFLGAVAGLFGFDAAAFGEMRDVHVGPRRDDPYRLLGIVPGASNAEIKAAYHRLAMEVHPDQLLARGLPPEFVAIGNARMAQLNGAVRQIRQARGQA